MEKLNTCEECFNLKQTEFFGLKLYGYGLTGLAIPHSSSFGEGSVVFHRVPLECPRPDSEVSKRDYK